MSKLIILKGLPASGKSTWAVNEVEQNDKLIIVSRDSIREMLKGKYKNFPFGSKMEELVTMIEEQSVYFSLHQGYNVILDATNFRGSSKWKEILDKKIGEGKVSIEIKDFSNVSLEECIERDKTRSKPVGEEVIKKMYEKYIKTKS
jgi:predicted kinase